MKPSPRFRKALETAQKELHKDFQDALTRRDWRAQRLITVAARLLDSATATLEAYALPTTLTKPKAKTRRKKS